MTMKRRRRGHELAQRVPEARLRAAGLALGKQKETIPSSRRKLARSFRLPGHASRHDLEKMMDGNDDTVTVMTMKRRRRGHKLAQRVPEARLRAEGLTLGKQGNDSFLAPQASAQRSGAQIKIIFPQGFFLTKVYLIPTLLGNENILHARSSQEAWITSDYAG